MSAQPPLQLDSQKLREGDKDTLTALAEYLVPQMRTSLEPFKLSDKIADDIILDVLARTLGEPERLAGLGTLDKITAFCTRLVENSGALRARREEKRGAFKATRESPDIRGELIPIIFGRSDVDKSQRLYVVTRNKAGNITGYSNVEVDTSNDREEILRMQAEKAARASAARLLGILLPKERE